MSRGKSMRKAKRPTISKAQGRKVREWIGKTPDEPVPPRVMLRIWRRAKGVCHISKRKIRPKEKWQAEHIKALEDGGEHRESNLAPALIEPHKRKSADEAKARAQADKLAKSHVGLKPPTKNPIQSRGFEKYDKPAPGGGERIKKAPVPGMTEIERRYRTVEAGANERPRPIEQAGRSAGAKVSGKRLRR